MMLNVSNENVDAGFPAFFYVNKLGIGIIYWYRDYWYRDHLLV